MCWNSQTQGVRPIYVWIWLRKFIFRKINFLLKFFFEKYKSKSLFYENVKNLVNRQVSKYKILNETYWTALLTYRKAPYTVGCSDLVLFSILPYGCLSWFRFTCSETIKKKFFAHPPPRARAPKFSFSKNRKDLKN